jgi:hypothetical protein
MSDFIDLSQFSLNGLDEFSQLDPLTIFKDIDESLQMEDDDYADL